MQGDSDSVNPTTQPHAKLWHDSPLDSTRGDSLPAVPHEVTRSGQAPSVNAETAASVVMALDPWARDRCSVRPDLPALPGYEVFEELGRGGMGVVYKARQVGLNRVVALKMILAGDHANHAQALRFRAEAEAVARLQHPNIVQVHEIGEHKGLPYFSLEYCGGGSLANRLKGTPLQAAAAAHLLEVLAAAMHAAHNAGVVHRDLKPANILLRDIGGAAPAADATLNTEPATAAAGSPLAELAKISDFGVAKCLDARSDQTASGTVLGTPSYMAPEQAAGNTRTAGPAADVYSLGAILYECLTGRPPFKAATTMDTLYQVLHNDPVPPRQLQPDTPRDLETICLKCLQKEPARRYATARAVAADLGRFRAGEPIAARPVSTLERCWRWGRRNPRVAGLLAALAGVIVLALTLVTILWYHADSHWRLAEASEQRAREQQRVAEEEQRHAEHQKRRAEQSAAEVRRQMETAEHERDKARRVAAFLGGVFEAADPLGFSGYGAVIPKSTGETLTVRELLKRGAERIDADTTLTPDTRAFLMDRIGNAYMGLGQLDRAEPLLEAAHAARSKHLGPRHAETAASVHHLARLAHLRGEYFRAEENYRQALALRLELAPPPQIAIADTEFNLAWLLAEMEVLDEAADLYRSAIKRREEVLGKEHREVGIARVGLAGVYIEKGEHAWAFAEATRARTILLAQEGMGKIAEAAGHFQQGVLLSRGNRHVDAEKELAACVNIVRDNLPPRHMYLAMVLFQLGLEQEMQNKDSAAEKNYRVCIDIVREQPGLTHPRVAYVFAHLTRLLRRQNRIDEARHLFDEWLAAHRARPGPFLADALTIYAEFVLHTDSSTREGAVLEEALALYRKETRPPGRISHVDCLRNLARNYQRAGRFADMEAVASEAVEAARRRFGPKAFAVAVALNLRAVAQLSQNKTPPSVGADLLEARAILTPTLPFSRPPRELADVNLNLGRLQQLLRKGDARQP